MSKININYYEVLGIPFDADEETIKNAYRQKVRQFHPDLHPELKDAGEKLSLVVNAYKTLIDPNLRSIYDKSLSERTHPPKEIPYFYWTEAKREHTNEAKLIEAEIFFIKGDMDKAVELCKQVIQREQTNAQAISLLAEILEAQGQLDKALTLWSYAVQFAPHVSYYQQRLERLATKQIPKPTSKHERYVKVRFDVDAKPKSLTFFYPLIRWSCLLLPFVVLAGCLLLVKNLPLKPLIPSPPVSGEMFLLLLICGFVFGFCWRLGGWISSFDKLIFGEEWMIPSPSIHTPAKSIITILLFSGLSLPLGFIAYIISAWLSENFSWSLFIAYLCSFVITFAYALTINAVWMLWLAGLPFWGILLGWLVGIFFSSAER